MNRLCAVCAAPASYYCAQDDALLCASCNVSIHSANALASKHRVVTVAEYMGEAQAAHSEASAAARPTHPAAAEDATTSLHGSEGVVPELSCAAEVPGADCDVLEDALKMDDADLFDLGNGWLEKLDAGIDLGAMFNSVNSDAGLVPTAEELQQARTGQGEVPSWEEDAHAPSSPEFMLSLKEEELDWLVPNGVPSLPTVPESMEVEPSAARPTTQAPKQMSVFQMPAPVVKVSRAEATLNRRQRLALYREKRKNRKFNKTIRYASRKAYAEVRPRIKGRFATPAEIAQMKAEAAAKAAAKAAFGTMDDGDMVVPCL